MKKEILLLLFILFAMNVFAKHPKNYTDSLSIENTDLIIMLDSIIIHEKSCDYYSEVLIFVINLEPHNNAILIGSIGNRVFYDGRQLGCFVYQNHLFVVEGKLLDITLFKKTGKKKYNIFSKSRSGYNKKTKEWFLDADAFQNDSYSYWYYFYKDGEFTFDSKSTCCNSTTE
ncbi:MAG: hypothetical protein LBP83_01935 [Dysgonamonadaceae bacterium]|jgi:hypothetical protein|nr:hypothetical protein [Dysgonamonadaceae bacterium]